MSKIFISYSKDSGEHLKHVFEFSQHLTKDGIECILPQEDATPPRDRSPWLEQQVKEADKIIVICTKKYFQSSEDNESYKEDSQQWEPVLTSRQFQDKDYLKDRVIPVLFDPQDSKYIPPYLKDIPSFCIEPEKIDLGKDYQLMVEQYHLEVLTKTPIIPDKADTISDDKSFQRDAPVNAHGSTVPEIEKTREKSSNRRNASLNSPYRYTGALDLERDKMVCISREESVNKIIDSLIRGEYWSILGSKQVGKTTLLRQIRSKYTQANCIYLNFELFPTTPDYFYQWLMEKLLEEIPSEDIDIHAPAWEKLKPDYRFLKFLEKFQPKEENKKIVLLFDEIEELPSIASFLNAWRQTFHERYNKPQLEKYAVVVTGSVDLIEYTMGTNSPFNITEKYYIKDFTEAESDYLISEPFEKLGIEIQPKAKEKLISEISGHPQLLQHTCHILSETAIKHQRTLTEKDVEQAIDVLFKTNTNLETLKQDIIKNYKLRKLVKDILKGENRKYHPQKEWAISGAGAIIEDENACCAIRNKIYENFLKDFFEISTPQFIYAEDSNYLEMESTNRYKLIQKVGEGGMGTVYKAKDLRLQRIVALKMIKETFISDESSLRRFLTEARTIARLSHPNIVTVFDVGKIDLGHFISMEFIEGMDLLKIIFSQGQLLTLPQIFYITKKLLLVLEILHRNKIIHRDIKPRNIMINHEGDIKIVDFGIAKIKTQTGDDRLTYIAGSPYYISPEQINQEPVDPRSDIYSVGITLFHLLTGEIPYKEPDIQTKHLHSPIPSVKDFRPEIPDEFASMVEKCMAKNKENRYQDIREMSAHLEIIEKKPAKESIIKKEIKEMIPMVDFSSDMNEASILGTAALIPTGYTSL